MTFTKLFMQNTSHRCRINNPTLNKQMHAKLNANKPMSSLLINSILCMFSQSHAVGARMTASKSGRNLNTKRYCVFPKKVIYPAALG